MNYSRTYFFAAVCIFSITLFSYVVSSAQVKRAFTITAARPTPPMMTDLPDQPPILACGGDTLELSLRYDDATRMILQGGLINTTLYAAYRGLDNTAFYERLIQGLASINGHTFLYVVAPNEDFFARIQLTSTDANEARYTRYAWVKIRTSPTVQPPVVNVVPNQPGNLRKGAVMNVSTTDPTLNYRWYIKNPNLNFLAGGTSYTTGTLLADTTFYVTARQNPGVDLGLQCESALTPVPLIIENDFFIPNIFTPNGDGKNDVFKVEGIKIKEMTLTIFDQWGKKIFETKDQNQGWDGKVNGIRQPVGVYVYVLTGSFMEGNKFNKKGSITLIR